MKKVLVLSVLAILLAAPAVAGEWINGAEFTLGTPLPSGCTAGAKALGAQGYDVLALGNGECGCVNAWFHDTSFVDWQVSPFVSVGTLDATNNNGCIEVTVTAYKQGSDLTTVGSPTATVIEDPDISAAANVAEYMPTSTDIAVLALDGTPAQCTGTECQNKQARICLKRVTTGICSSTNYPNDIRAEAIFVDKTPP